MNLQWAFTSKRNLFIARLQVTFDNFIYEMHVFYCHHFLLFRITFVPLMDKAREKNKNQARASLNFSASKLFQI